MILMAVFQSVTAIGATTWAKVGYDIDGEAASDNFGRSVSLNSDGTVVAIGDFSNLCSSSDSGHVGIFSKFETFKIERFP